MLVVAGISSGFEAGSALLGGNATLTLGARDNVASVPLVAVLTVLVTAPPAEGPRLAVAFAGCFNASPSADEILGVSCGVLFRIDPVTLDDPTELDDSGTGGIADGVTAPPGISEGTVGACGTRGVSGAVRWETAAGCPVISTPGARKAPPGTPGDIGATDGFTKPVTATGKLGFAGATPE